MESSLPISDAVPHLTGHTVPIASVTPAQRTACWQVFQRYYEDVERGRFDADFEAKDHVILLSDEQGIRGFCTLVIDHLDIDGRPVVSVFTGDTIIDEGQRGTTALQWQFFKFLAATKARYPARLVVWFLISKGYKTYLTLTRNLPDFYPRHGAQTPAWADGLIRELARRRFGREITDGHVLTYEPGHGRLKPGVAPADGETDPDILFFLAANPGHAQGDELCCVGLVNARLMWFYPLKLAKRLLR